MKTLLLTISLVLTCSFIQAQDLEELKRLYASTHSNNEDLIEGVSVMEKKCTEEPSEQCNSIKAINMYLLSERFYRTAYDLFYLDQQLSLQCKNKALGFYNKAIGIYPAEKLNDYSRSVLLSSKKEYEKLLE